MPEITNVEVDIKVTPLIPQSGSKSAAAETARRVMNQAKKAGNKVLSVPRAIIHALSNAVYWLWANGIQITGSYPNGKSDAEVLTARKVFNQLVGFVFSTVATNLVRLAHIATYVTIAAPYFFAVYALISLAPISIPAAAGIAALTVLTSPFIINTVLSSASKAFWENPSNKINALFFELINKRIGNDSKVEKGFEFDYIGRLFHKMGYQASDFVLSLPGKAYRAAFGVTEAEAEAKVSTAEAELEHEEEPVSDAGLGLEGSKVLQFGRPRSNSLEAAINRIAAENTEGVADGLKEVTLRHHGRRLEA